jgi:hypothetical protein
MDAAVAGTAIRMPALAGGDPAGSAAADPRHPAPRQGVLAPARIAPRRPAPALDPGTGSLAWSGQQLGRQAGRMTRGRGRPCHLRARSEGQSRYRVDNHGHHHVVDNLAAYALAAGTHPANMPDKDEVPAACNISTGPVTGIAARTSAQRRQEQQSQVADSTIAAWNSARADSRLPHHLRRTPCRIGPASWPSQTAST